MNPFLRFRMLFVITALIGALNTVTSSRSDGGEEDYSIPEDVCRLEITLPPSSAVTLDGKNYGVKPTTKRSFRFRNLERETLRKVAVNVRFRDGKTVDRVILAQGGDLVRLVLVDPNVARPGLVLQTGHTSTVTSVAFSPDGKQVLTGSVDGTVRLWDVLTGDELVRILSLDRGEEWLVVTPDGLFDGSPGGRQRVSFRIGQGLNVVPVDRFRNDFYWPGLLGEICRGERPMPDVDIGASLPPLLRIVSPQSGNSEEREIEVVVEATDQGGGVSDVRLFHNIGFAGRAILREERFNGSLRQTYRVDLVEGPNTIRVTAFSRDRSWEAEPAEVHLRYEKPLPASELYVLCVGVDRYEDPDLNLRFASGDAKAMADLFGGERTRSLHAQAHVTRLLNDQATKEAILDALEDMADATREQDTLIVLLAGHGEVVGDCYYFVPHDFRPHAGKVADDVKRQGVMDEEIFERLGNAPARKRILMLATCHAGAALQLPYKKRRGMADRRRQERLVRSYGVYSLAAASAEKQAHESDAIRHGVFAYTLLAGLNAVDRGPLAGQPIHPADPGGIVDVSEWVSYLARNMPEVSQELFGFRQYPVHIGEGSFPLLPLED